MRLPIQSQFINKSFIFYSVAYMFVFFICNLSCTLFFCQHKKIIEFYNSKYVFITVFFLSVITCRSIKYVTQLSCMANLR